MAWDPLPQCRLHAPPIPRSQQLPHQVWLPHLGQLCPFAVISHTMAGEAQMHPLQPMHIITMSEGVPSTTMVCKLFVAMGHHPGSSPGANSNPEHRSQQNNGHVDRRANTAKTHPPVAIWKGRRSSKQRSPLRTWHSGMNNRRSERTEVVTQSTWQRCIALTGLRAQ